MNSLRRDLMERRLWPVVALLILAIAAVPFVLRQTASAVVTPPPPPHASATAAAAAMSPSERAQQMHALEVSLPRDPFASGMPKLSTKPAPTTTAGSTGASASATGSGSSTGSSSAGMVSPSPATPSGGSSTASGSSGSSGSSAGSATVTTTTTVTTPTTTTNQWATVASDPAWTIYSVALRFGSDDQAPVRSDVARLTPLPSVAQPRAMFMGVLAGGQRVVFALGAGVQHAGQGVCRPSRARCAAIVLAPGQIEQLQVTSAAGVVQTFQLGVVSITGRATHSRADALAAFNRHSAAGLCELDLADPVTYSQTDGTLAAAAAGADCKHQKGAVPFPGSLTAP